MYANCFCHFLLETHRSLQFFIFTDLTLACLACYHAYRWNLISSLNNMLLVILHVAFLWLCIGAALYSIQSLYLFFTAELILARAPLHSLTIGFISAILIAMATRVSLGHSGRPLEANNYVMTIFTGIGLAAILRILADTSLLNTIFNVQMNILAALVWIICMLLWVLKFAPIYLSRRADGKPG